MSDERDTMDEKNNMNMEYDRNEPEGSVEAETAQEPGIEELRAQVEDFKDRYLRAMAEMENMKKRQQRQHADVIKYGKESVLKDFLLVYDSLEKSILSAQDLYPDDEPFITGLQMIERLLLETLKKHGVEPIQTRDIAFDPNVHDAMMQVSRPDLEPGMVADEIEKGFMLNDRVLRPAKVTVSA
ncbi:MAG TPA: nucleotide exchange factor GrpE [Deltaproteobacteria bacterium]|nr:nucleotide exchange factor GrpE [Deltaproteobacteria bacterium]